MGPGVGGEWRGVIPGGTIIVICPLSRLTNLVGAGTNHPPYWCASRSPPSCGSASFNGGPIFPRRRRTTPEPLSAFGSRSVLGRHINYGVALAIWCVSPRLLLVGHHTPLWGASVTVPGSLFRVTAADVV